MHIRSYADCAALAATRKRKLDRNTYLEVGADHFGIRLHATEVVQYFPDGRIVLNSGGWKTPTTKERINNFSPITLSQDRGIWYAGKGWSDRSIVFADGITFTSDAGTVSYVSGAAANPKAETAQRKAILKFAADYMRAFAAGDVPAPNAGDCWYCMMKTPNSESLGDAVGDTSHLDSHITEPYFVPSLLANALKASSTSQYAREYVAATWASNSGDAKVREFRAYAESIAVPQLRKALADYILRRFGMVPSRTVYK